MMINNIMSKIYAIIPAAGLGKRFGRKKQFDQISGKYILDHTLHTFLSSGEFEKIIVTLPEEDLKSHPFQKNEKIIYVRGGSSRAHSVHLGFLNIDINDEDKVLIHDGVRPLLSSRIINNVISELKDHEVVVPAMLLSDTIKEVSEDNFVKQTIDRDVLRAIQTPQGFLVHVLKEIYDNLDFQNPKWTDESMLAEALGKKVKMIEGEKSNIKITTPVDIQLANFYMENRDEI